jgi:hypothetical protein
MEQCCIKFPLYQTYKSWQALSKKLENTGKVLPGALGALKSYLQTKVKEKHSCYMAATCDCAESLGASQGDVADNESIEDHAHLFWPSRN